MRVAYSECPTKLLSVQTLTQAGGCCTQGVPLNAIENVPQKVRVEVRLLLLYLLSLNDERLRLLVLVRPDVACKEIVCEQSHAGECQYMLLLLRNIVTAGDR